MRTWRKGSRAARCAPRTWRKGNPAAARASSLAHPPRRQHPPLRALVLGLALLLPSAGSARAGAWAFGTSAFVFDPPDDDAFVSPIVEADRGVLHLEARYNYEDLKTGSAFIGRTFEFGTEVSGTVVPMIGLVLGRTDAVAPG